MIAHAAVDLDAEARHFAADVGAPGLDQRRQHIGAQSGLAIAERTAVDLPERIIGQRPRRHGQRPHPQQHPPHVGMVGDRARASRSRCPCSRSSA